MKEICVVIRICLIFGYLGFSSGDYELVIILDYYIHVFIRLGFNFKLFYEVETNQEVQG